MKKLFCISISALSVFFTNAQADTAKQPSEILEEVSVSDYRITADASFKSQNLRVDSLNQTGRQTLAEILRNTTPVFVKSYGGNGIATLSLRGTGASHTAVFWNNLELNSPMLGLSDLSTIPAAAFNSAELQYGFASISDGSGALGGSLRLNSQPDYSKKLKLNLGQFIGSFGQRQTTLGAEGRLGKLYSQTQLYHFQAENNFSFPDITEGGFPEKEMRNNSFQQQGLLQNLYYRIDANKLLSLKAWYNEVERKLPPPITGNLNQFDQLQDRSLATVLQYQQKLKKSRLLINSGLHHANNIFINGSDSSSNNNRFLSWQNNLRLEYNFSEKLSSESGLGFDLERAQSLAYADEAKRTRLSLFSNWNYRITEKLLATAMLREERVDEQWSPPIASLGVVYQLTEKQKARANVAHNFRFASLNDLYWSPGGNLNLRPERSWNFELGYEIKGNSKAAFQYQYGIAVFHNLIDNWIQWAPAGNYWSPQNLKSVQNTGVEIDWQSNFSWLGINWKQQFNYAYTRSQTIELYDFEAKGLNNQLPYVPLHSLSGGLSAGYEKWEVRYQQNFSGRYFTSADNQTYMPAYTVSQLSFLNKNLLKHKQHGLSLAFNINNLCDMPYQILPYRPEPGINYSVQLTYSWEK